MRDDCIIWTGKKNKKGYGVLINKGENLVHRLTYQNYHGPIPDGMYVCHKCDQRDCYNLAHLFLGTPQDNTNDMIHKGRMSCGQKSPKSKLTNEQVKEIFLKRSEGIFLRDLAKLFCVRKHTIYEILTHRKWKHTKEWFDDDFLQKIKNLPPDESNQIGSNCHNAKLKEEDIRDIRKKRLSGMLMKDIGSIYGVSDTTIEDIIAGRTWRHVM